VHVVRVHDDRARIDDALAGAASLDERAGTGTDAGS
jgi:hypothetical protein